MTVTVRHVSSLAPEVATFKHAMRRIVGGVSVITAGTGECANRVDCHIGALALH